MKPRNCKKTINIKTGKVYDTAKEVSIIEGWNYDTFKDKLNGRTDMNDTPYRYVETLLIHYLYSMNKKSSLNNKTPN
jgi:hypothetical protein